MSGLTMSTNSGGASVSTGAVELTESSGRALKLQTDAPHLVSMGGDRLSTAVTLHPIPQGQITLGSGAGVDIAVHGTGVLPIHCHIENSDGIVTVYPTSGSLSLDGSSISSPTRLTQGVMLTIGRSNYMHFNHPAEAKMMKSVLPNSRISMAPINFESDNYNSKFLKKPPVAPRKSPRDSLSDEEPPSTFMTKVSKFEYLASQNFKKSISPKVFSSNLVTVNTPARDVLGRAPPDLQNYTKNISQPAVNYSETTYSEKQKNKTPDRQLFGCKSPAYVNVTLNETKTINNKVVIFENGCIPKPQNILYEQTNELNNIPKNFNKNVNMNKNNNPPAPFYRSVTPGPISNNCASEQKRLSGSLGDLTTKGLQNIPNNETTNCKNNDAEIRRNQAQVDRIKEQELEKVEQARLEEILNMCAEYDKQIQIEKANKPTPNRIKTNGSLPRDKRAQVSPSYSPNLSLSSPRHLSPSQSKENQIFKFDKDVKVNNCSRSIESMTNNSNYYEVVEFAKDSRAGVSSYENVTIVGNGVPHFQQSPRTRIKTFVTSNNKDSLSPKDQRDNKFTDLNMEMVKHNDELLTPKFKSKTLPPKFILPMEFRDEQGYVKHLENYENLKLNNHSSSLSNNLNISSRSDGKDLSLIQKIGKLKEEKREKLGQIARLKRQMAEMENHGEELNRELELEKALIIGEFQSKRTEIEKLETRKDKLIKRSQKIYDKMNESQLIQESNQQECKEKLFKAQENLLKIERELNTTPKNDPDYNASFEEFLLAQEILDNERKNFEDLEFHHLEEEADWLASREELQREILEISKKIDNLSIQILDLDKENSITTRNSTCEYIKIKESKQEFSKTIDEIRAQLKTIDLQLINLNNKESDDDLSTDSDSEKNRSHSNLSFNKITDLSCSYIISSTKIMEEDFNMSQSFNEKMFHEKSILEDGLSINRKIPSQDDIDRISKVTIDSPLNIEDVRGSLGKKTIEEIERNRQIHLVQQGSQVIENERRRVLALKQKVQNEVRTEWAQRKQDCQSYISTGSEDAQSGVMNDVQPKYDDLNTSMQQQPRPESEEVESPRPLSETSDISVEVGGTLGRRRRPADKHRPLTRYLPIRSSDLDLRNHIESAGHQADLCPHVRINSTSCRGFLHKRGSKLNGWSRRWFVFDRTKRTLVYYSDKTEKKPRGGAYFQAIEEVYLDHANSVKSPNSQLTFIVKTHERYFYLMAPSPEAMRIWIDVIFTGAEGYQEFEPGT